MLFFSLFISLYGNEYEVNTDGIWGDVMTQIKYQKQAHTHTSTLGRLQKPKYIIMWKKKEKKKKQKKKPLILWFQG